jgi:hypothetical protein
MSEALAVDAVVDILAYSKIIFLLAFSKISSSIVPLVTNR